MLSIDAGLIVVFVLVWILLFVLKKVFFNPLNRIRMERDAHIHQDGSAGKAASESAEKIFHEIESKIKEARNSARALQRELESDGIRAKEQMVGEISKKCREQISAARLDLEKQLKKLKKELEEKSKDFADRIERNLLQ